MGYSSRFHVCLSLCERTCSAIILIRLDATLLVLDEGRGVLVLCEGLGVLVLDEGIGVLVLDEGTGVLQVAD